MLIIGIDPGQSGGIAVIPLYSFASTRTYPLEKMTLADISTLLSEMRTGCGEWEGMKDTPIEAYLELPSLNPYLPGKKCRTCKRPPMRNSNSYWSLGRSVGQLEGLLYAHNIVPIHVNPRKWMNYLNCSTRGNKKITYTLAQNVFPFLTRTTKTGKVSSSVTHAVADSLLIALYGYLQYAKHIPTSVSTHVPHLKGQQNDSMSKPAAPVPSIGTFAGRSECARAFRRCPPRRTTSKPR